MTFALLLVALLACTSSSTGELPTTTVTRGEFLVHLPIPGELEAVKSTTICAPDLGGNTKVTFIADEGTQVKEGDVLVEFERTELENRLLEQQNKLDIANIKISQKKSQLDVQLNTLADAVSKAQLSLDRAGLRVTDSEAVPRVDRDSAKLDMKQSALDLERSKKDLESARLQGEAELELLRLEAAQAQAEVDTAEKHLATATLRAPSDGLVIKPEVWKGGARGPTMAGDSVWNGTQLITLPDMSAMQVIAWVHETDAEQVKVDQPVSVIVDAHPETPFPGKVQKLADLAVKRDREDKSKHLKVTVSLETPDPVMKPGLTVRAEVLVDEIPDVLSVPQEALFYEGAAPYVFLRDGGAWERTPVTAGRASDTHVVVTEGLSEGQEVALVDPEQWARGEKPAAAETEK